MPHRHWSGSGDRVRIDPDTVTVLFAAWSLLNGLSLVGPGEAFAHSAIYQVVLALRFPEPLVGIGMLANGVVLLLSLLARSRATRATVALVTATLWVFWSLLLGLGAARAGYLSSSAAWSFLASLALASSVTLMLTLPTTHSAPEVQHYD